jgi:hypothetical protein
VTSAVLPSSEKSEERKALEDIAYLMVRGCTLKVESAWWKGRKDGNTDPPGPTSESDERTDGVIRGLGPSVVFQTGGKKYAGLKI